MDLFERAKRELAKEVYLKHMYSEDERPHARSLKRLFGRPISRFARVPPTRKQLSKATIAIESTGFDWLRAAFTGELQGRYVIREPFGEKVRRWFNITQPDSDYTDSDLVTFFHRQKPIPAMEEYAASIKTDPAVQKRAVELAAKARSTKLEDSFLGPDGLVLVKLRQENDNRNQPRGHFPDVKDIAIEVASRFEARNRILDSLHQDGLVGITRIHRAVVTPKHADRLAAFLDIPRTQEEYHRFWMPDPQNRD